MVEEQKITKGNFFSRNLLNHIELRLRKKEQIILFLNRRGFSTCLICKSCGNIVYCENCNIPLTYHKNKNILTCHRCDTSVKPSGKCPKCKSTLLKFIGFGTEKVERQIKAIFPEAKVARIDSDIVKKKGALEDIWNDFRKGKIDILIGTQMIAKGLDIPNITFVGIIAADLALNIPDFRSVETTFQLVTQVAGRSGRGDVPGEVIVQCYTSHPVFAHAVSQDYESFFNSEIEFRKELKYPPFVRFILLTLSGKDEVKTAKLAKEFSRRLMNYPSLKPERYFIAVPAPVSKLKSKYRWNILISTRNVKNSVKIIQEFINKYYFSKSKDIVIDVDPLSML